MVLLRIVVPQVSKLRGIATDDAMLAEGFHSFETANPTRWTTGDAVLPNAALAGCIEIVLMIANPLH